MKKKNTQTHCRHRCLRRQRHHQFAIASTSAMGNDSYAWVTLRLGWAVFEVVVVLATNPWH
jgi:hypothetical protein